MENSTDFEYELEHNVLCVIRYSHSVQTYNTITLFCHLIVPFLANLCSGLFIIFGTARRRSTAQTIVDQSIYFINFSYASFDHII